MKPNLEALKRKDNFLTVQDLIEVLGTSRTTIYKHETQCIHGFPRSICVLGKKGWPKSAILDYIKAQTEQASKFEQLMIRGRAA